MLLFILLFQLSSFGQEETKEPIRITLTTEEGKEDFEMPFAVIEEVPVFPGCEEVERDKRMNCFQAKMIEHIQKNLKYPKEARRKNIQGRVVVMFVINKDGVVENIIARGPKDCEILEKEAIRIISLLPNIKPGMQKGKPVKVKYAQPMTFKLQ